MSPHLPAAITLTLIILAVTLCYAFVCWVRPFRACRRCRGIGRKPTGSRRSARYCRPCRGTGRRLRVGRWFFNQLAHHHRGGTQ